MACKAKDVFHGRSYRKRTKLLCRRGEERQADGEIGFGCGPGHKVAEKEGKDLLQVKKKQRQSTCMFLECHLQIGLNILIHKKQIT